jgi:hypothetical protein
VLTRVATGLGAGTPGEDHTAKEEQ